MLTNDIDIDRDTGFWISVGSAGLFIVVLVVLLFHIADLGKLYHRQQQTYQPYRYY